MASPAQIQANLSNSTKSTGPTSSTGKAVSRFNALKSGIYSKELVLPGEDPAEFEALAADYRQQIGPLSRIEHFLVDSLIENDWRMRRLRKAETQLWAANADPSVALGENTVLTRLYRLIAATRRVYSQSLKELMQQLAVTEPVRSELEPAEPEAVQTEAQPAVTAPPAEKLASFRQELHPAPAVATAAAPLPEPRPQTATDTRSDHRQEPKINLALRL